MDYLPIAEVSKTPKEQERELLTEIANEASVSDWHDLRWFHVGGNKPRAIIVCKRGKSPDRVKTISANKTPEAWKSWQPVLEELLTEKKKNGKKRMSHKKLQTGKI